MHAIRIIAVGKVKEKWIQEGINEFLKRLSAFTKVEVIELKDEGVEKEGDKIMKYLDKECYVLDETGEEKTSAELASLMKDKDVNFVIGGHDGTSEKIKKNARLISLSKLTFTHEMCRLFLVEQIYRGFMILNNRRYHR